MHGWRHHAARAARAERWRATPASRRVSVSHKVSPLMKLVGRGDTTVVDAYLSPILRRYVDQVQAQMPGVRAVLHAVVGRARPRRTSSRARTPSCPGRPAASSAWCARRSRPGTTASSASTWAAPRPTCRTSAVARGEFERAFETQVAGVRMRAPMMSIHTVAAGGGSILGFDGARLRVGPQSAGANPGPACYRRGGPLAVTDANVMLGTRRSRRTFRAVFGPSGDQPLDRDVVATKFEAMAAEVRAATGRDATPEAACRTASCRSRWRTWPTRSSASRSRAATTSPTTRCSASAAPAGSTPARSPTRSA